MSKPFVTVLMGSDSDPPVMQATPDFSSEVKFTSAHRTPDTPHGYVKDADQWGCDAFTAAAGLATKRAANAQGVQKDARLQVELGV